MLQSRLYGSQQSDADEYADLFDAEVTRVLEINAPLRTGRRRCSGQHDMCVLSAEAVEAKRHHRRAERRYRRTGLPSDERAFNAACNAARTSVMTSRTDHIRAQLQQASGDVRATWHTAQSLLHSRQKVICDDSEFADLVSKFSSFFVDKVRRIRDNIASALQQSSPRMFAARPHTGPELSDFQPVAIDEVRKLLASIPRKTSPLDVMPVTLLKDCAEAFAPVITTHQGHSTETALLDVLDSVYTAADSKEVILLTGLDLSAAFDTVCHSTLIKRLHT